MQIKLFVPTHDKEIVKTYALCMNNVFSGCVVYQKCTGYWTNESDETEIDEISIIETFTSKHLFNAYKEAFYAICEALKTNLKQKCITYTIDNEIYFI